MLNIRRLREEKGYTQDDMVAKTGIPKRSYVDYESGKADIKLSILQKIAITLETSVSAIIGETKNEKNLTDLNGKENGKENGNKPNIEKALPYERLATVAEARSGYNEKGVPLIPIDAMAGFGSGAVQVMDYDAETYVVPEFTELNVDFMIRVKGSSMYPKYNSGDLVACKKLLLNDIFFQWNKVYVLDTEQGALIKRVKKSEKEKCITLVSENASYDAFELSLSEIHAIALVVGVIRLE